jgi:hypothetical protein
MRRFAGIESCCQGESRCQREDHRSRNIAKESRAAVKERDTAQGTLPKIVDPVSKKDPPLNERHQGE